MLLITRGLGSSQTLIVQGLFGGSVTPPTPEPEQQPTGGWDSQEHRRRKEYIARRRRIEREELEITETEQRRIDRVAAKIRKRLPEGLIVSRETIVEQPAYDALLTALQPTEGQALALAQAIYERIVWAQRVDEADEEAALLALLSVV